MRRVFILEDDPLRMKWFRMRLHTHEITHADSCTQVDRFQPPYDFLFLDHDLGGRAMSQHEDNGEQFAKLIRDKINGHCTVVVHSFNPDGAQNIRAALGPAFIAPFLSDWFNQIVDRYL